MYFISLSVEYILDGQSVSFYIKDNHSYLLASTVSAKKSTVGDTVSLARQVGKGVLKRWLHCSR